MYLMIYIPFLSSIQILWSVLDFLFLSRDLNLFVALHIKGVFGTALHLKICSASKMSTQTPSFMGFASPKKGEVGVSFFFMKQQKGCLNAIFQ